MQCYQLRSRGLQRFPVTFSFNFHVYDYTKIAVGTLCHDVLVIRRLVENTMNRNPSRIYRRAQRTCARCRNHSLNILVRGHKRYCKYRHCVCDKCFQTAQRQKVTAFLVSFSLLIVLLASFLRKRKLLIVLITLIQLSKLSKRSTFNVLFFSYLFYFFQF